ncbi:hypothetical protein KY330_05660 [Candidatus Woesearchaeota archaeon]|nr:hypothetical protein [Candidatus Woesearchaeota archaeon]
MVLNETIAFVEPLATSIGVFVETVKYMVGGIFGLYLILIYLRWKEARNVARLLKDIRHDIRALNRRMKVREEHYISEPSSSVSKAYSKIKEKLDNSMRKKKEK